MTKKKKLPSITQRLKRIRFTAAEGDLLARYDAELEKWYSVKAGASDIVRMARKLGEMTTHFGGSNVREMPTGFADLTSTFAVAVARHHETMQQLLAEDANLAAKHRSKKSPITRMKEIQEVNSARIQDEMEKNERKWNQSRRHPGHLPVYRTQTQ